jgi:hypothetical protein
MASDYGPNQIIAKEFAYEEFYHCGRNEFTVFRLRVRKIERTRVTESINILYALLLCCLVFDLHHVLAFLYIPTKGK